MLSFVVRFVRRLCLFVVVVGYFYSIINTDTRFKGDNSVWHRKSDTTFYWKPVDEATNSQR